MKLSGIAFSPDKLLGLFGNAETARSWPGLFIQSMDVIVITQYTSCFWSGLLLAAGSIARANLQILKPFDMTGSVEDLEEVAGDAAAD